MCRYYEEPVLEIRKYNTSQNLIKTVPSGDLNDDDINDPGEGANGGMDVFGD